MNKNIIVNKLNKAATISNPNRTASVTTKLMTASVALNNVTITGTIFESNLEFRQLTKNFEELVTAVEQFNAIRFTGSLATDENAAIDNVDYLVDKVTSDVLITLDEFLRDIESIKIEEVTFQETLSKSMSKVLNESFNAIESIAISINSIADDEEVIVDDEVALFVSKNFKETVTIADVILKTTSNGSSIEIANTSDIIELELDKGVLETFNAVETFKLDFKKSLYEELTTPEEVVITALDKVAEHDAVITIEDFSRIVTFIRDYADIPLVTDTVNFSVALTLVDSITLSDVIISAVIGATSSPEFFEAGTSIDQISSLLTKIFTEILISSDISYNIVNKGVIEVSTVTDNIQLIDFGKNLVETINQIELYSFSINTSLLDSLLVNEAFIKTMNISRVDSFLVNETYSTFATKILADITSSSDTLGLEPSNVLSDNTTLIDSGESFLDNYIADYYTAPYIGTTTTF